VKKLLKILLIVVGALVALVVVAAIALPMIIKPNDYKDDIVKLVHDKTGRTLELKGDIQLSVFPWLGLELGKTSFSNAPGFDQAPMAQVDKVEVKLKLLPLLRKKVEVNTIVLDGLQLNLARDRNGVSNWDDLVKPKSAATTEKPKPAKPGAPAAAPLAALTIGGIDVRHGRLKWRDGTSGQKADIQNLTLQTSQLQSGQPMQFKLGFDLETGKPVIRTPVNLDGDLLFDLDKETLRIKQLQLSLLDLTVQTSIQGQNMLQAPSVSGHLALKPANLRSVLTRLGIPLAMQADALQSVSVDTDFAYDHKSGAAAANNIKVRLDDSTLTGKVSAGLGSKVPAIRFQLTLDKIDVDRYLPPETQKPAKASGQGAGGKPKPLAIPIAPLLALDVDGQFALDSMKAMGIRTTKIRIPIKANKGLVNIGPSTAQMYGGTYKGKEVLDVRAGAPKLSMEETLSAVQVGDLLKDAGIFDKFSGIGNVSTKLTARGLDQDDVLNSLNGNAQVSLKNGRVKGVNLYKMVTDARTAYEKAQGKPVQSRPAATDEMEYANLTATAVVKNGIVTNNDLKMDGPFTRVTGAGTANLPKLNLDYRLQVLISENKSDDPVPVRINGPFSNLSYSIEWNKILEKRARKEVEKRVDEEKKKVEEQLKQQLGDELQKLFKR